MSEATEIKYETMTVKSIRGREGRTIEKWEKDGWELVSQTPGKIQTEIALRRPKKKFPIIPFAILGGLAVVGLVIGVVVSSINGGESSPATDPTAPSSSEAPTEPSATPEESTEPSPTPTETAGVETITVDNNAEFAAILQEGDYCSPLVSDFAEKYEGKTIEFDASIGAMNNHEGFTTRHDLLIGAGDFSETASVGPAFQFRDVNASNLNFTDNDRESFGVGDNLHVVATVEKYEQQSCLFLLEPVETSFR
ncbi:hypothetical protein GCM10009860_15420 [Microbacterium mitrae]|uniref:DUF4839 domain-containing protein n=1 Tax=Microbacterium mitrae TaxID=664640 RepID=A0A5C8HK77_9MICO|nr:DUF4839 domain-containing protein [Microbacterium mitrae]TXK03380.1 DUF4839 domain-containing protein [Microbacterium mitrae]